MHVRLYACYARLPKQNEYARNTRVTQNWTGATPCEFLAKGASAEPRWDRRQSRACSLYTFRVLQASAQGPAYSLHRSARERTSSKALRSSYSQPKLKLATDSLVVFRDRTEIHRPFDIKTEPTMLKSSVTCEPAMRRVGAEEEAWSRPVSVRKLFLGLSSPVGYVADAIREPARPVVHPFADGEEK